MEPLHRRRSRGFRCAASPYWRSTALRPPLRPTLGLDLPHPDAAPEPAWRELRLPIPRDVVASLDLADERPDLVQPHHWRALEERLHRHVMRRLPEGARQVRVELDPESLDMRVRYRVDPGEEAQS